MTVAEKRHRESLFARAATRSPLDVPPLLLELNSAHAVCVVSQLQLALRHPSNAGPMAETARRIAMQLIDALPEEWRDLLMLGFDEAYDVQSELNTGASNGAG